MNLTCQNVQVYRCWKMLCVDPPAASVDLLLTARFTRVSFSVEASPDLSA